MRVAVANCARPAGCKLRVASCSCELRIEHDLQAASCKLRVTVVNPTSLQAMISVQLQAFKNHLALFDMIRYEWKFPFWEGFSYGVTLNRKFILLTTCVTGVLGEGCFPQEHGLLLGIKKILLSKT